MNGGKLVLEVASVEVSTQARQAARGRAAIALRCMLFLYLSLVLSPVRYEIPIALNLDNTWMFGLNYAAAHHLTMGRDFIWTFGPLCYLLVPFDISHNLAKGLMFQAALWVLIATILPIFWAMAVPQGQKNVPFPALASPAGKASPHTRHPSTS